MLENILTIFVLYAAFCNADDNATNATAEQLLGHWMVVTEHNTHRPLNMAENTCVSIFKDFNENLKFRASDSSPLFDVVVQRTTQGKKEFLIRDGEQEAKLVEVYPNELVWESKNELVVFYRIDIDVFPRACQFGRIPEQSLIEKLDKTLFDEKSLEYWFSQLPEEQLSNHPLEPNTHDNRNTAPCDKSKFIAHDKPQYIAQDKYKFMTNNKPNSFIEGWKRKMYNFHRIRDEASPRTVSHYFCEGELSPTTAHYPKLGLTKQVDENLYQNNLHSRRGAYGQAFKKLNKLQKLFILNSWKDYCMDQRSLEYECYRTPHRFRKAEIESSFEKGSYFYHRDHFEPRKFSDNSLDLSSTRDSSRVPTIDSENLAICDNTAQNFDLFENMKQNMINALENEHVQKCAECGNILWNPNNGMCTRCTTM